MIQERIAGCSPFASRPIVKRLPGVVYYNSYLSMIWELTRRPPRWATSGLALLAIGAAATAVVAKNLRGQDQSRLFLNVSYDPTRELYREIDRSFSSEYARTTGR